MTRPRNEFRIPKRFGLDRENPGRKQHGENDLAYKLFTLWLTGSTGKSLAELADVSEAQISKLKTTCCWSVRKTLIENQAKLAEVITEEDKIEEQARFDNRYKPIPNSRLPLPPAPTKLTILEFAEKYAPHICPGYIIDPVAKLMLTEMAKLAEGKITRLIVNPPPRSSKTLSSIIVMAWSILRDVGRSNILLSANQRLSALNNQMLKDLVMIALPEGYELSQDANSKLGWKVGCQHAAIQVALSRGASLLGWSCSGGLYIDDICGSVDDANKPDLMESIMKIIQVDALTRLTPFRGRQAGLCIVQQRLGRLDPTGRLIAEQLAIENEGGKGTRWTVVACPFVVPSKEKQADIVGSYPGNWLVKMPKFDYGKEGQPVSSRFSEEFLESVKTQMPRALFECLYLLNTDEEEQWSSWKRDYVNLIGRDEITIQGQMMALDMGLSRGGDESAAAVVGISEGRMVITGLYILPQDIDDCIPAIAEIAHRHSVHTIGVEAAAGGFRVLDSLSNNFQGKSWNIVKLSHEGRSKKARQQMILGPASAGLVWAYSDLELLDKAHSQMRSIALDRKRDADDLADALTMALRFVNERWIKSGFKPTSVTWAGGSSQPGATPVIWGRGSHALMKPLVGIDGVERYAIEGFS